MFDSWSVCRTKWLITLNFMKTNIHLYFSYVFTCGVCVCLCVRVCFTVVSLQGLAQSRHSANICYVNE